MKSKILLLACITLIAISAAAQTQPPSRVLLNAVTVEADGKIEAPPDLAELTFDVFAVERELRRAYERATASLQQITALAGRNSISADDVTAGRFLVQPITNYDDRKQRARAYRVSTTVVFRIRDFARIPVLLDDAVASGVAEFRAVNYMLADEEAAKQRAVSAAMRSAMARARAAVGENGQKLGALQSVNVDVRTPYVSAITLDGVDALQRSRRSDGHELSAGLPPPPPPALAPDKITVVAKVQCIFRID